MLARSLSVTTLLAVALLAGCSRGDGTSADSTLSLSEPDSFLIFPNPQVQVDGSYQVISPAYAQAYYAAIDPANAKDTLDKWKAVNGFDSGTGQQVSVVFHDRNDLGYGRRMTARRNVDGSVAVMVENYNVTAVPGQEYTGLNVEAAAARERRWHIGTNAIEFSLAPNGQTFAKFFNFSPSTGARQLTVNLDGRGQKAVPTACITCHGGRGDPLNANGTFPNGGNTRARLQPLNVDTFGFSTAPGYARTDMEAALKTLNQFVLCTYPLGAASALPEDACRTVVSVNEWSNQWQATAAEMIKAWYGGDGMPNATFSDTYVPAGWVGQETLYQNVVAPYCRACHILRGTANMSAINFMLYDYDRTLDPTDTVKDDFRGYADRIKAHVIDRGNMPLGLLIYERFWESTAPETLADFLEGEGYTVRSAGAVLRPGRPVADPGPDRTVRSPVTLSASNSLYASSYAWSIVSAPVGATASLSSATAAQPVFTANMNGDYVLQLIVANGSTLSDPVQVTITIDSALTPAQSAIVFSDIKAVLQALDTTQCVGCHDHNVDGGGYGGIPPIYYGSLILYPAISDFDRDGDSDVDAADELEFYTAVRGRVNFTDVAASPLLRKPTGNHHYGGHVLDFSNATACAAPCSGYATWGDYYRAQYNLLVNWILNGAPYN
jgi:mono/diheme cytochrome c family protein